MLSRQTYSLTLGRAVGLIRSEAAVSDQKAVLRALVALSRMGPIRFSTDDEALNADGVPIPETLIYAADLSDSIRSVGAHALHIDQHASPSDLLTLVKALATRNPHILDGLASVAVGWDQGHTAELMAEETGVVEVPDEAIAISEPEANASEPEPEPSEEDTPKRHLYLVQSDTAEMPVPDMDEDELEESVQSEAVEQEAVNQSAATVEFSSVSVPEDELAAEQATVEGEDEAATAPVDEVARLMRESTEVSDGIDDDVPIPTMSESPAIDVPPGKPDEARRVSYAMLQLVNSGAESLPTELEQVERAIRSAISDGELEDALDGVVSLVNLEREVVSGERAQYTAALERVLTEDVLRAVVGLVEEGELQRKRVGEVVLRSGPLGVQAILELVSKDLPAEETLPYIKMLLEQPDGANTVTSLIGDLPEERVRDVIGAVVRADVPGVPTMVGTVAITSTRYHSRAAAIQYLARMGEAADGYLSLVLQHGEAPDRRALLKSLGPESSESVVPLIETLLSSDEGRQFKDEAYRALGRLGTARAVTYLIKAALPGGRFFGRRTAAERLPAIHALGSASGPAVIGTLEELASERDKDIRAAAREALESLTKEV